MFELNKFDLLIVGGGPAGLTASIQAAILGLNSLLAYRRIGGKLVEVPRILDFPSHLEISGIELAQRMIEQAKSLDVNFYRGNVNEIVWKNGVFRAKINDETIECENILLAVGLKKAKLNHPKEKKYLNRGISYNPITDILWYLDRPVAILGECRLTLETALHLSEYASQVVLLTRKNEFKGETPLVSEIENNPKIKVVWNVSDLDFKGEKKLEELIVKANGKISRFRVEALFIQIGFEPNSELAEKLGIETVNGYIKAKLDGSTNVLNVYAAGAIVYSTVVRNALIRAMDTASTAVYTIHRKLSEV